MGFAPENNFNLDDPSLISVLDELPYWSAPFGIKLLEKVVPKKNMAMLDIGFGTGFPLTELAGRLGKTCRIYGIDPWKAAVDRVMEKIRIYAASNIELLIGTAENIPLPDNCLDLIVSNNGLNNVDSLDLVLSECARTLKKNGRLVFTMNTEGTMLEFYDVMEVLMKKHNLPDAVEAMKRHIYEKRKPLEEVLKLLQKHGFVQVSVDHDRFSYTFADGTTMFKHFLIRLAFLDSWKKLIPDEMQQMIFSEIESRINRIADKDGFFRLSVPFVVIDARKNRTSSM
jgi:ubiquinone/menaquinone biosynthesis C-methylase UbiE